MTHDELVKRAAKWLRSQGCGVVIHDGMRANTGSGEQPDAIGWRGRISILVECKASRADFLSDRKKVFRVAPHLGMGDWRFYLCPPHLIERDELPEGWGLLYATEKTIQRVHGVPGNSLWHNRPLKGAKECEIEMMYSALRRLNLRGCLERIYEPVIGSEQ